MTLSGFFLGVLRTLKVTVLIFEGDQPPHKLALLFTYMKLRLNALLRHRAPESSVVQEHIVGFQVESFGYANLLFLFEEIFADKGYYFKARCQGPLILDVGSNIGMALLYFKWLYTDARVLAFEPDAKTFQLLKSNVERNHLKDVTLVNKAVGDSAGTVRFYYNAGEPGSAKMTIRARSDFDSSRQVECVPLSHYVNEEVDFLKMDVEGAEQLIMQELERSGKLKYVREMVMEYHLHLTPRDDALSKTLAILERNDFGYQIGTFGRRPFRKETFQGVLLYAYRKSDLAAEDESRREHPSAECPN
jgi:FkbM family methyltransferase